MRLGCNLGAQGTEFVPAMSSPSSDVKITDVKTTLLTGPRTNDPFVLGRRKLRSAAFIEVFTDSELVVAYCRVENSCLNKSVQ